MWLGPNAVLAFKREGYRWSDVGLKDLVEILTYPGFYRLALKYAKFGSMEMVCFRLVYNFFDKSVFINSFGKKILPHLYSLPVYIFVCKLEDIFFINTSVVA